MKLQSNERGFGCAPWVVSDRVWRCGQWTLAAVVPLDLHWRVVWPGRSLVEPYHVGCSECYASTIFGETWVQMVGFGPSLPRWTGDASAAHLDA